MRLLVLSLCLLAVALAYDVKVNIMMPLDIVTNDGRVADPYGLQQDFHILKQGGTDGIMLDVWWGIAEQYGPKQYDFSAYQEIAGYARDAGLSMQAVMSFHRCGGNVGDDCDIPLPSWVLDVARADKDLFYRDQWDGYDEEYLSWAADTRPVFQGRTALEMYSDYMYAFADQMCEYINDGTLTEVQVGPGPCGELRYPSYQTDRWSFPGIGAFQAWGQYLLADWQAYATNLGHPEWTSPPTDAGGYNTNPPSSVSFFQGGYKSEYGKAFLSWYSQRLIDHGANVLAKAQAVFGDRVDLAMKIAGIHWWYGDSTHAAELTAGYYNLYGQSGYAPIARMFGQYGARFDFTCLEMTDAQQSGSNAACMPEELVHQTMDDAAGLTPYCGENALARYDWSAYTTIEQAIQYRLYNFKAFTYLRLDDTLMQSGNLATLEAFIGDVHRM
ncbi:glycoside hydrolase, family 14 [Kipferlia bialata]|uniref:Beta-amylase n=1 Tax=Kipferlia bialata TaxID=797122 RepID=A0A9K3D206_9EUKA|nr:glycoside hydrolase, family 14 [Kipferlia bialata]|eukprot:g8678.t1